MRLGRSQLISLLTVVTALLVASASAASASQATKPRLSLTGSAPITVAGVGFIPRERLVVRVSAGGDVQSKVTRTTLKGRFVAVFGNVTLPECVSTVIVVSATGIRGTTTFRRRTIPPPCGPAPQP